MLGYVEPESKFRKFFYNIAISDKLSYFIFGVIGVNTIVMCFKWPDMSDTARKSIDYINYVFIIIFLAEVIIKIVGLGKRYFREGWNIFDFLICGFSILAIII